MLSAGEKRIRDRPAQRARRARITCYMNRRLSAFCPIWIEYKLKEIKTYTRNPGLIRGQILMRQIQYRHKDDSEPDTATPIPMYSSLDFVIDHHFTRSGRCEDK